MLQRNAGFESQSPPGALRREDGTASSTTGGSGALNTPRVSPANLVNPKDLANVPLEASVVGEQYLIFSLMDCELALKAEHIQGVERLADVTPVPNVVSWIKGVINLRGSIASVVDLRSFLGMEVFPHNPRTRLLSVRFNEMVICLVVDSVSEMTPIPASAIVANSRQMPVPQWLAPYAEGSALVGKRNIIIMEASRILFSEKMQHYS